MSTDPAFHTHDGKTSSKMQIWVRAQAALGADLRPMLLHSHRTPEELVKTDVDCGLPKRHLPMAIARRLAASGLKIVQHVRYESTSHDFVLAAQTDDDDSWSFLHVDFTSDFRFSTDRWFSGRVFLTEKELLRPACGDSEVVFAAPDVEFGYTVVKRIVKASLESEHGDRLATLYREGPVGCRRMLARFWGPASVQLLADAASHDEWSEIRTRIRALRRELLLRSMSRRPWTALAYWLAELPRLAGRWMHPTGLHVAFLGPDGSGKSSVIQQLADETDWPFSKVTVRHLGPMMLRGRRRASDTTDPHGQVERPLVPSIAKALYWLLDYSVGYQLAIRPALVRTHLVLYDRYLVDALVDPKRYRYGGPAWLMRLIWRTVPKPDLVIVLDAPADELQSRKREVSVAETARQRAEYVTLGRSLRGGRVVDASQPLERVVADVRTIIVEFLAVRTARRLRLPVPQ